MNETSSKKPVGPGVRLHIERLVLEGVPVTQAQAPDIQAAIESELVQLLSSRDLSGISASASGRISAGQLNVSRKINSERFGRQIARKIHHGLMPQPGVQGIP